MQTSKRFAQYVRENGVNSGNVVCGIYRLVDRLQDGRQMVATFIDPYNQGVDNPQAELRVFVPHGLDVEETGLGNPDSIHVFEQDQWMRLERSDRAMQEYHRILNSYLRSLQSRSPKALGPRRQLQMAA